MRKFISINNHIVNIDHIIMLTKINRQEISKEKQSLEFSIKLRDNKEIIAKGEFLYGNGEREDKITKELYDSFVDNYTNLEIDLIVNNHPKPYYHFLDIIICGA